MSSDSYLMVEGKTEDNLGNEGSCGSQCGETNIQEDILWSCDKKSRKQEMMSQRRHTWTLISVCRG